MADIVGKISPLMRETEVQGFVMRFYEAFECRVIRFAEGRRTRVSPGWPDIAVFVPRKRVMFLHEVKRPGGKQSEQQSAMQVLAESCGIDYVCGGVQAASEQMTKLGLLP